MERPISRGEDQEIAAPLEQWGAGDQRALDRLMPLVYEELKRIAGAYLNGERGGHTLQPTALVHEGYLRLLQYHSPKVESRKHFLVLAAQVLRRVLVDHARHHDAGKRHFPRAALDSGLVIRANQNFDMIALDDALHQLGGLDAQKARIVELRYFAGLTVSETAGIVGLSPATVKREWAMAKAWLYRALNGEASRDPAAMA
jgi:RNA polymerase sigma factor (TIGR02999 family)